MSKQSIQLCPFFYNVTGERARQLLFLYGKLGEFLVRPSDVNKNDRTMSVHCGNRVTNIKLPFINNAYKLPSGNEFMSLTDIVNFVIATPKILSEKDGKFIEIKGPSPIPRCETVVNIGYDRFFHIGIGGVEAEELLKDEQNGTYLVRESISDPGEFALSCKNDNSIIHIRIFHEDGVFRVVPKDSFSSLSSLLENYIYNPMVQNGGAAVRLKSPLLSTRFTAATIDYRIECLLGSSKKSNVKDGIVDEFEGLHSESESQLFISCKEGRKSENIRKNRYRNVIPYDHTRVKLQTDETPNQSDYINANLVEVLSDSPKYLEFKPFKRKYISTQGCLPETVSDFWNMVWQQKTEIIVMLTREVERGKAKCVRYWPLIGEELEVASNLKLIVKTHLEKVTTHFAYREFLLGKTVNQQTARKISHFQLLSWEDNDTCPINAVLKFIEEVNNTIRRCPHPQLAGPVIVHCSAGIGRTGTFIVLDILINRITDTGPQCVIDIQKTIKMLREQRTTMVQTEAQYRFIYCAISAFMKEFHNKYALNGRRFEDLLNDANHD